MSEVITTGKFRVSFPHLFTPSKNQRGDDVYDVTMLIPKEDTETINEIMRVAKEAAIEKWPKLADHPNRDKPGAWFTGLKGPIRDGVEKIHIEGYEEDIVFARASTRKKVAVVDQNKRPITDSDKVYPGCYARAMVNAWC